MSFLEVRFVAFYYWIVKPSVRNKRRVAEGSTFEAHSLNQEGHVPKS